MLSFTRLAIVALSISVEVYSQGIRTFQKEWTFQEKEIILSRDQTAPEVTSAGENRFLYTLCEESRWKSRKKCDVIVETYTSENMTYKSTCKLHLETEKESRMIGANFMLTHLGANKAILMWLDRERTDWSEHDIYLHVWIIDWPSCEFESVRMAIDMQNELIDEIIFNNVVVYENTFDVFFYSRSSCATGWCKATFDAKGKRLGKVESFLPKKENPPLSLILSSGTGLAENYFVTSWGSGQLVSVLVSGSEDTKDIVSVRSGGYVTFGSSNKYDTLGLCWLPARGDTMVRCTQTDKHANPKLNVTLSFGYKVLHVRMHNLADGGFLLLQFVCTDKDCLGYNTFYVSRIYADGHHDNRPLEVTGIEIDVFVLDRYRINLFEKGSNEFCVSVAGPSTLSEYDIIVKRPRLTFVSKCFHKQYVSIK